MSVFRDLDQLLKPALLENFHGSLPPVRCIVHRAEGEPEAFDITPYPFDTLDGLKQLIMTRLTPGDSNEYLPPYTFVGIRDERTKAYQPLDYVWFKPGPMVASFSVKLPPPGRSVPEFSTPDGNLPPLKREPRGRTTIEDLFPTGVPPLHVFSLESILSVYKGARPVSAKEWNRRFLPCFPTVASEADYTGADKASDDAYRQLIRRFVDTASGLGARRCFMKPPSMRCAPLCVCCRPKEGGRP